LTRHRTCGIRASSGSPAWTRRVGCMSRGLCSWHVVPPAHRVAWVSAGSELRR
jgi:hypothetical protein